MNNQPPKIASRFLEWYCPSSLHEGIAGDLEEKFERDLAVIGRNKARWKYTWNVMTFFRPEILLRNNFRIRLMENFMIRNYLKIAFRALWRAKVHTLINVFGLALGIACCLLISLYVRDEITFDQFHSSANRIYRVYSKEDWGENRQFFNTVTPFPMGPTLKDNVPEIENEVRLTSIGSQVKKDDKQFNEQVKVAGKDFFKVFDFQILKGTAGALEDKSGVVLTEKIAEKYFGVNDPINQVLTLQVGDAFEDFTVKAVVQNAPTNSSIQFNIIISDLNHPRLFKEGMLNSWFNIWPETYVRLAKGANVRSVENKFPPVLRTALGDEAFSKSKYKAGLQPLADIHLNTEFPVGDAVVSNPKYSYILSTIAVLVLLIACINFVTLSVGRSAKRAKEVGIRKVIGALRKQLVMQFVGEAVLVTLFALVSGVALAVLGLSVFNELSGKQLVLYPNQFLVVVTISLLLIIGLISGSYPAFFLSSFQPVTILKGTIPGGSRQSLRKVLVGVQLMLSILLVSSTLLMREQLTFIQTKDLGFDKDQLVVVKITSPVRGGLQARVKAGFEKAELFKTELAKASEVISSCGSSHDFGNGNWVHVGYTDDKSNYRTFAFNTVDDEYISTMEMKLVAGRNFSDNVPSDKAHAVIVNESFVKEYGWDNAIGKKIPGKNFFEHEIIGVVKDFNFSSLYSKVEPLALVQDPNLILGGTENVNVDSSPFPKLMVRLEAGSIEAGLAKIKNAWTKISGEEELSFTFADQSIARQYKADQNLGKIMTIAAVLAIVIGSLGLYALASLAMQNRTKEISIRKVMGASSNSLLYLLSKEYVLLVIICLVIAAPITSYLMSNWLSAFEYRVNINPGIFILAGAISLLITLTTISFQLLKTVWTNPVKSLKYE